MSVESYCDHAAGFRRPRDLHDLQYSISERKAHVPARRDTVELDEQLVLEGDAAREHMERIQAAEERALPRLLP